MTFCTNAGQRRRFGTAAKGKCREPRKSRTKGRNGHRPARTVPRMLSYWCGISCGIQESASSHNAQGNRRRKPHAPQQRAWASSRVSRSAPVTSGANSHLQAVAQQWAHHHVGRNRRRRPHNPCHQRASLATITSRKQFHGNDRVHKRGAEASCPSLKWTPLPQTAALAAPAPEDTPIDAGHFAMEQGP